MPRIIGPLIFAASPPRGPPSDTSSRSTRAATPPRDYGHDCCHCRCSSSIPSTTPSPRRKTEGRKRFRRKRENPLTILYYYRRCCFRSPTQKPYKCIQRNTKSLYYYYVHDAPPLQHHVIFPRLALSSTRTTSRLYAIHAR